MTSKVKFSQMIFLVRYLLVSFYFWTLNKLAACKLDRYYIFLVWFCFEFSNIDKNASSHSNSCSVPWKSIDACSSDSLKVVQIWLCDRKRIKRENSKRKKSNSISFYDNECLSGAYDSQILKSQRVVYFIGTQRIQYKFAVMV